MPRAQDLARFAASNGRLPRARRSDATELGCGSLLTTQRYAHRKERLLADRVTLLDQHVCAVQRSRDFLKSRWGLVKIVVGSPLAGVLAGGVVVGANLVGVARRTPMPLWCL